ncbi:hypothetical protein D3C73_963170 [compost metagenome]
MAQDQLRGFIDADEIKDGRDHPIARRLLVAQQAVKLPNRRADHHGFGRQVGEGGFALLPSHGGAMLDAIRQASRRRGAQEMGFESFRRELGDARGHAVKEVADGVARECADEHSSGQARTTPRQDISDDQPGEKMGLARAGRTQNEAGPRRSETSPGRLLGRP